MPGRNKGLTVIIDSNSDIFSAGSVPEDTNDFLGLIRYLVKLMYKAYQPILGTPKFKPFWTFGHYFEVILFIINGSKQTQN
jgi:hypothetical protein